MRFSRDRLVEIIEEEVRRRVDEIREADDDSEEGSDKDPGVQSADQDRSPKSKGTEPRGPKPADRAPNDPPEDHEPDPDDQDAMAPDPDAVDASGEAGDEPSGAVNDEVSGKTIQSISVEPESKTLPGSKEVTLTFDQTTDPLKILVTPTGEVKFLYQGKLSDIP